MTKEELLSQLKGIHLPTSKPDWWDMAPGWYVLLVIIILFGICGISLYFHLKNKKQKRLKLLKRVDDIYDQYCDNCHQYAGHISVLLKQAVLKLTSDKSLMTLHGDKWQEYLKNYSHNNDLKFLIQASYDPKVKFDTNKMNQEIRSIYIQLIKN